MTQGIVSLPFFISYRSDPQLEFFDEQDNVQLPNHSLHSFYNFSNGPSLLERTHDPYMGMDADWNHPYYLYDHYSFVWV